MVRILLRKVDIVKLAIICLGIGSQVMAEEVGPDKAATDKAYRIELLVYQQPEGQVFGNVQPSKYLKFVNQSADESLLPAEKAYSDQTASSSMRRIMSELHSRNVLHLHRSWIIRLDPSEKITLPLNQTITQTAGDTDAQDATTQHESSKAVSLSTLLPQPHVEDGGSLIDGIRLNGSLTLVRNHYMDMSSHITFEIVKQGHVYSFDHSDHTRHLKLDKTQYLDNESLGMLIKVTLAEFNPPVHKLEQEREDAKKDTGDEQTLADAKPGGTDPESYASETSDEPAASSQDNKTAATTQIDDTEDKGIGEVDGSTPENVAPGSDQSDTESSSSDSTEISDQSTPRQASSVADSIDTSQSQSASDIRQHSPEHTDLTAAQDQYSSSSDHTDLSAMHIQKKEPHEERDTRQPPSTSEQNTSLNQDDRPQKKQTNLLNTWLGRK